jgi:thymidylate synthase
MYFTILFACDKSNGGFSYENKLPFKVSKDMEYFRKITNLEYKKNFKNVLIMGKNTFLSKPSLNNNNRIEFVISRTLKDYEYIFESFEKCLEYSDKLKDIGKIFLIGGKDLIEKYAGHPKCEEILLNLLDFGDKNNIYDSYIDYKKIQNDNFFYHSESKVENDNNLVIEYMKCFKYKTSENNYLNLLKEILEFGETRKDRTGTGTLSLFGPQIEIDISESFPLITTKKINFKNIVTEVIWFLSGSTNIKFLKDNNVNIWDGNTTREFLDKRGFTDYEVGEVGPLYGYQWRNFGGNFKDPHSRGVDQIDRMLTLLKTDPMSRRIFMSSWNPIDLDKMALEPCHVSFQLYVSSNNRLNGKLYMRSNDLFLGAPWNIACYSLLIYMFCHLTGYFPGKLVYSLGDSHIYLNHIKQVEEQLNRPVRPFPVVKIANDKKIKCFEDFDINSFELLGYDPHSFIKAEMAI